MSVEYEDECVGCEAWMGCLGSSCPNRNVPHIYCDGCGAEDEEIYRYEEKDYCRDCLIEKLLEDAVIKKSEADE